MASINGIALKAIKTFTGSDGIGFNANIYIDNKKAGSAYDGGYGGMVEVDIEPKFRDEFKKRVETYFKKYPSQFNGHDNFIDELFNLAECEKHFKKVVKQGFPFLVDLSFTSRTNIDFEGPIKLDMTIGAIDMKAAQRIVEREKPVEYEIYSDLKQFNKEWK